MFEKNKKLAITVGDPAGVGPEVVESALKTHPELIDQVVLVGHCEWVNRMVDSFGVEIRPLEFERPIELGVPSIKGASLALRAMTLAAEGCLSGEFSGVVTGPISKYWCQQAGMTHPGQTEFFASHWSGIPTMAFYSNAMIVSLVTWHVPLMEVWSHLSQATLSRTLDHTVGFLEKLGFSTPKIGVCGFNPHAGEDGQIGREEVDVLNPIVEALKSKTFQLSGCHPADTLFYRHVSGEFDAVLALYHDQALAPLKTVAFHDAVNVTLGLSHVRTSPDHGTAYSIAGKGEAKPDSMISAIKLALRLR